MMHITAFFETVALGVLYYHSNTGTSELMRGNDVSPKQLEISMFFLLLLLKSVEYIPLYIISVDTTKHAPLISRAASLL